MTGVLVARKSQRSSPAGTLHVDFELEHQSRQRFSGVMRLVRCRVLARASGERLVSKVEQIELGERVLVKGPLSWESSREDVSRLVVMASDLEKINS